MINKIGLTIANFKVNKIEYKNNKHGEPFINLHCKNEWNKYFFCVSKKQEILKKIKELNINVGDFICILGIENIHLDKAKQQINISYWINNIIKINIEEYNQEKITQNKFNELIKKFILNQNENNTNNNQENNKEDEEFTNNIFNAPWELDI